MGRAKEGEGVKKKIKIIHFLKCWMKFVSSRTQKPT